MKNLTAGETLRLIMKREGVKQIEFAEKLGINHRSVSKNLKVLDENKGNINTLVEYAAALGYEVEFNLKKLEEK